MPIRTALTELLGLSHPIVQAPMAGTTTPELVAAVSGAGALGSHGCAAIPPDRLREEIAAIRARSNGAFNLNFFCHDPPREDAARDARLLETHAPLYAAAGATPPEGPPEAGAAPFSAEQLEVLLEAPPPVVSFHFGLPDGDAVARLKRAGCRILSTATTVAEARDLDARGVDAVIAQGWEAGGHRGHFLADSAEAAVGLFALLPQVVDAVGVPVIAAGGIADGRGIAAALALGAAGVQIGTAFVLAEESAAPERHRAAVADGGDAGSRVTRAHSGRPARAHRTAHIDAMAGAETADFPLMYHYSVPLQQADPDRYQFSLYGQGAGLARAMPAAALVERLAVEAEEAFARLPGPR